MAMMTVAMVMMMLSMVMAMVMAMMILMMMRMVMVMMMVAMVLEVKLLIPTLQFLHMPEALSFPLPLGCRGRALRSHAAARLHATGSAHF